MTLKDALKGRISLNGVHQIISQIEADNNRKQEIYDVLFSDDDTESYQAAWVLSHFPAKDNEWLYDKQDQLIGKAMAEEHTGKRRIILQILHRQPLATPPRVDFLDFCLAQMIAKDAPPAIQSLCIKLAYEMCRQIPELLTELTSILEIMDPALLTPATRSARNHILKAMKSRKSIQCLK